MPAELKNVHEAAIAYDVAAAAALVGLSYDSLNKAIKDGDLVAKYPNSKPLIGREELKRWFDALPDEKPAAGR